jgi:hypothetical protein
MSIRSRYPEFSPFLEPLAAQHGKMRLLKRAFRPISPGSLLKRMRQARSACLRLPSPWQAIILAMGILSAAQALHADRQTITEDRLKGAAGGHQGSYARRIRGAGGL